MQHKKQIKVLIIEDSPHDRELYKSFLTHGLNGKYDVITAPNGREGREELSCKPDCVLLDYQLPDMTGLEFLLSIDSPIDSAIVMITGKGDERIAAAAIQNGAKEYLKKGYFSRQDLLLSITMALEKKEMSRVIKKQNEILEKKANTDSLTNLLNRSAFITQLEKIFSLCKLEKNFDFGLMFIDIDKFKQVNDNFGHLVGDHLIQKVAWSIKKICSQI